MGNYWVTPHRRVRSPIAWGPLVQLLWYTGVFLDVLGVPIGHLPYQYTWRLRGLYVLKFSVKHLQAERTFLQHEQVLL